MTVFIARIFLGLINLLHLNRLSVRTCQFLFRSKRIHITQGSELIALHQAEIEQVGALLADDESRRIYRGALERRRTWNPNFTALYSPHQYLIDEFTAALPSELVIVDGGAYTGDTIETFYKACGHRIKTVHAFEIVPEQLAALSRRTQSFDIDIKTYPYALYKEESQLAFRDAGFSSFLSHEGEHTVRAVALDDILHEPINLIKLDVEGAEQDTLLGARRLIEACRPHMAICLYHHARDFWDIPLLLREWVPDYSFYIRHHGTIWNETVLYCVPPVIGE